MLHPSAARQATARLAISLEYYTDKSHPTRMEGSSIIVLRTHSAGQLGKNLAGDSVTLAGWVARRRDHGGVIFIDLRDHSGYVQAVFRDSQVAEQAHTLRSEYCLSLIHI